ncbi:glycerophosphodiester phosphodiesterase GDPD4-like isoform X2 [Salvia divinorum]|uniref:glycerophosphodiester phosphodiesterase n=1 Tax=Salvia divinorum TaxID=28513 RepID=A0ABD1GIF3_SALDI
MAALISRWDRQQQRLRVQRGTIFPRKLGLFSSRKKLFRLLLISLAIVAIVPPLYFHFSLRSFRQMQLRKCSWMSSPPLVCAHGGDSTKAFPNTMDAYRIALSSQADCIEIDVSRSSDGILLALHDRELQRLSGNTSSKVGYLSRKEIADLGSEHHQSLKFSDLNIPTIEEALRLVSGSVKQVILDVKVGPPLHEKGLGKDILSVVERTNCKNCLVWAKSDSLARELIRLSNDTTVGYIVMMDPSSGTRMPVLRMRGAGVVGVYHPLIDEKLVKILHGTCRRKKKVFAWTVDEESSMQKILLERVDAVITGNPSLLLQVMQDRRKQCFEEGFSFTS